MKLLHKLAITFLLMTASSALAQTKATPSLKDTLGWMQTTLKAGEGKVFMGDEVRSLQLTEFSGCRVHFTYMTSKNHIENFHLDESFDLADIDSQAIAFGALKMNDQSGIPLGMFIASIRNDAEKISSSSSGSTYTDSSITFEFAVGYGIRFVKAFKVAVKACGGKPSLY